MQALILAAGMGSRLGKYTQNSTKCMVRVAGKTLLERIFDSIRLAGIRKVVIVDGYCAEKLEKHAIEAAGDDMEVTFIYNQNYNTTNNIHSLFLASEQMMEDDTILFESDLIFDISIIKDMVQDKRSNTVAVARFEEWMDGTVTTVSQDDDVTSFIDKSHFKWDNCNEYYKTVNIYKISKEFFKNWYYPFLEAYIKTCGKNSYYEMVLKIITNINNTNLKAFDITGRKWYEIDTPQDLQIAETMFNEENRLEEYQKRFGGYWRFKNVTDYCYLVNPWFPTVTMQNEMRHNCNVLLTQYPSGQKIINTAMACLLGCGEEYVITGNGAAELINVIGSRMTGKVFLTMPAFHEYIRCFKSCEHILFDSAAHNYKYTAADIISASKEADTVIVINPDNPSGNFIPEKDMKELIEICGARGQKVIIDESFADFADPSLKYTLIADEILRKYPHLRVIKSISKSYGVPGCRLGALCSADTQYLAEVSELLPVWNINSFGEYFLQIFEKYRKNYEEACLLIAQERERFRKALEDTGLFEVYPSQANYIMCRLKEGSSRELADKLLEKNILIKDLSSKKAFDGKDFIRLAVRTTEENTRLVENLNRCRQN